MADVRLGKAAVRQAVDSVVQAGLWNSTVFMLTWDDWGGFDDSVATPTSSTPRTASSSPTAPGCRC